MATDRVLFSLLERAGQLLREGATGVYPNLTKPELLEFAATARALAASAEAKVEATTLQQRVLNYYTIHGTSDIGCDVHVAARCESSCLARAHAVSLGSLRGSVTAWRRTTSRR